MSEIELKLIEGKTRIPLKECEELETHLNLAVDALEVAKEAIVNDSGYGEANEIIYEALNTIKGETPCSK